MELRERLGYQVYQVLMAAMDKMVSLVLEERKARKVYSVIRPNSLLVLSFFIIFLYEHFHWVLLQVEITFFDLIEIFIGSNGVKKQWANNSMTEVNGQTTP